MVDKEEIIKREFQKYGKEYNKLDKEKDIEIEEVILFFSFDVVNSSYRHRIKEEAQYDKNCWNWNTEFWENFKRNKK